MKDEDDGAAFAAMRALPEAEKQALFAAAVSRTLKGQLAYEPDARPELETTIARLDIDFAKHVRTGAAMFWSRIRKDRILAVARATLGPVWASARAKYKKADLARAMEEAFAADAPAGLNPKARAATLAPGRRQDSRPSIRAARKKPGGKTARRQVNPNRIPLRPRTQSMTKHPMRLAATLRRAGTSPGRSMP